MGSTGPGCQQRQQQETERVSISWQQAIVGEYCSFNPINPSHGQSSANPLWARLPCHPIISPIRDTVSHPIPSPPPPNVPLLSPPLPRSSPAQCMCLIARSVPFNPSYAISPPTSRGTAGQQAGGGFLFALHVFHSIWVTDVS
ncbi:hypothetical protein LY78DRAFT_299980 [Colletotrichum sublineola]|nr:hypothetical protein LY78DRAFT_299980 [Colletotrichum sublineola]